MVGRSLNGDLSGVPQEVRQLSVNQKITALAAGDIGVPERPLSPSASAAVLARAISLDPDAIRQTGQQKGRSDLLLVGTQTSLLAYDVDQNRDIFYKGMV